MEIGSGLGRALIFELIFFFPFSDLFGVAHFLYFAPDFLKPLRAFHANPILICAGFF